MRVVLITGTGCSGKTWLAERYLSRAHVLSMDLVVRDAANRACPYLREFGRSDSWFACPDLWEALERFADTQTVVRTVVEMLLARTAKPRRVLIAEGFHLRLKFWKSRLLSSLPAVETLRTYRLAIPDARVKEYAECKGIHWNAEDIASQRAYFDASADVEFDLIGTPDQIRPDLERFLFDEQPGSR